MSNPEYTYNGLRNLLLPQYPYPTQRRLNSVVGTDDLVNAIKLFSDEKILVIYHDPNDKYREQYHDDYVNCTFHSGYLEDIADEGIIFRSPDKSLSRIPLDYLLDVIPAKNIDTKDTCEFKLFKFNSIDVTKPTDTYNIIGCNPARAFILADIKSTQSLYLSSIDKLRSGMQFNEIRNE